MQTIGIKDIRSNLSNIIDEIYTTGESVVITKFGKPKVIITKIDDHKTTTESRQKAIENVFGIWKDKSDDEIKRKNTRHEKIFD